MSLVDLERIAARADRSLGRLEQAQIRELRGYLSTALSRSLGQTELAYRQAMRELEQGGDRIGPSFRLARGRVLADEIEGTMRGLKSPPSALELSRLSAARAQGTDFVRQTFQRFEAELTLTTPINHEALASVVENASTRLSRHGVDTVARVKEDVVTGLVRGDSWTKVSRQIRQDTGLLATRADTIALTELHSAQADARARLYGELGVQLVMRYVTIDDRTCPHCAGRQGEVTKAEETTEVLHPRCRCVLAPYNPEWTLDDELPADELEAMRTETIETLRSTGADIATGPAPFERGNRPRPVWTPGDSLDALTPWIGRAFTNLGPLTGGTGGAPPATPAPASPGLPTAATSSPDELSRTLPPAVRRRLAEIKDEAGDLEARVAVARARQEAARKARDEAREAADDARTAWNLSKNQFRDVDQSIANAYAEVTRELPEIRAMPYGAAKQARIDAEIRRRFPGLLEERDELEALIARQQATLRELNNRYSELAYEEMNAHATVRAVQRGETAFLRDQAHEVIRNEVTGHTNGSVTVKVRIRSREMKERAATAQTWLNEHATFDNGPRWSRGERSGTRAILTDVRRTKSQNGRAFHRSGDGVYVAPVDGVRTYLHELGHAIEDTSYTVLSRSKAHLAGRTVGESAQRLQNIYPGRGYGRQEISKPDAFGLGAYVGKIYSDATEILSMGLEHMFHDPIGFAEVDPDHFDYVLRVMKGLPDP